MIRIGFDAKRLLFNQTGLGNYSRQWVEAISKSEIFDIHLYSPKLSESSRYPIHTPIKGVAPSYWRTHQMGYQAEKDGCQIFHGLSNEIPRGKIKIPRVCTVHDVIFKEFPSYYAWGDRQFYNWKTKYACDNSQIVIATSETTKAQLVKYYDISPEKVQVVYQSIDPQLTQLNRVVDKTNPYIIYHSSFNERKNHEVLVQAFLEVASEVDFSLVLVGNGKSKSRIEKLIEEKQAGERVKILSDVENDELYDYLASASAFVYPSKQEGFGIPLLEAAAIGLPMIVSDTPIFREISEGLADAYVNANSVDDWANTLKQWQPSEAKVDYSQILRKCTTEQMMKSAVEIYQSLL
jgi:glycosyltransferase involved in cell wall biosynthesis